jgi:hypothetical protein
VLFCKSSNSPFTAFMYSPSLESTLYNSLDILGTRKTIARERDTQTFTGSKIYNTNTDILWRTTQNLLFLTIWEALFVESAHYTPYKKCLARMGGSLSSWVQNMQHFHRRRKSYLARFYKTSQNLMTVMLGSAGESKYAPIEANILAFRKWHKQHAESI